MELVSSASLALEDGDEDLAFDLMRQAYRISPRQPEVVFMMARLLGERRRFHEAIQLLDQLSTQHADMRLPILGQTADWMIRAGEWSEAEKRFIEILQQVPDAAIVHRNLAQLYIRQGHRLQAVGHLNTLSRIGDIDESELRTLLMVVYPLPTDAANESFEPIGPLGIARNEISKDDWGSAQTRLESVDQSFAEATALLGRVYATNAKEALQKWIEANPSLEYADAWFAYGIHAAKESRHGDAIRLFAKCVIADQTDSQAYDGMSQSLQEIGLTDEAKEVASRAELIRTTQRIGGQMAESTNREEKMILDLAELLDQLRRPLEAIAWRGVALAYARSSGASSETEIEARLDELKQARSDCLASESETPDQSFRLCGVDLDALADPANKPSNRQPSIKP
ncbi:MAG: tetratricopeptide repeat protein [Rubripirellula sp.]